MANDQKGFITVAVKMLIEPELKLVESVIKDLKGKVSEETTKQIFSDETIELAKKEIARAKSIIKRDVSDSDQYSKETQSAVGAMNAISSAESKVATEGLQMVKKGLGFLEEIHARLVSASPLLRTIESLFNLAVQLFFMPLGNKLAEVMIPAVIELVDQVTEMWAAFEGKSLGQILEIMIEKGAQVFGNYFNNLASQLSGQGTLLGSISSMLSAIGNFIQDGTLVNLMSFGVKALSFMLEHIKEIIATLVAFKVASLANQIATMFVIATSGSLAGKFGAGAAVAAAFAGTAISAGAGIGAGLTTYNMMNGESLGDAALHAGATMVTHGGYDIGKAVRSKITSGASGTGGSKQTSVHNTFNFNGLTDTQLEKKVRNITNEQYNNHRLQSNYG